MNIDAAIYYIIVIIFTFILFGLVYIQFFSCGLGQIYNNDNIIKVIG